MRRSSAQLSRGIGRHGRKQDFSFCQEQKEMTSVLQRIYYPARKSIVLAYNQCSVTNSTTVQKWFHTSPSSSSETKLAKTLKEKIKSYYMRKDIFGENGDFTTSPEISQMFGELIGVWFYERWINYGSPEKLKFVELGPGRGTLVSDILRVFKKLGNICKALSLHLVEISPAMRDMQRSLLCNRVSIEDDPQSISTRTEQGVPITWHHVVQDIPKGFSFYLANEFFDALPIHQFKLTKYGWREILVGIDKDMDGQDRLKFFLAPNPTPAMVFIPEDAPADFLEVRPQANVIAEHMAQNMQNYGGCSLLVDYGDYSFQRNTLRAFKKHQLTDPLKDIGNADLTSNVNFSHLQKVFMNYGVSTFGPVTQRHFLKEMGIDVRKQVLLKKATSEQTININTSYQMLTDDREMGNCFKFFAAISENDKPSGF
ncbi:protein arginine methyltransferase NDUFAF7, mitochondrial-like isoform X2 [Xenia sp. Carnegie-2017]|uniref:protein arginine methyltransferase NDUFAF7, mitochondrial-like isoform X2 n=1 Tax=Xenia sp. Carnegie-2017 TaxID=2897299 RepID=UPI001F037B20|nr:protein arginine methyltransferase NDUFAF7, mitochondrial-like isoform X2 [Xenia sp. Carnegie-2017]